MSAVGHCEGSRTSESHHASGSPPASEVPHTTSSANSCESHDDHWHCPPGVSESTYPPEPPTTSSTSPAVGPTLPPGDQECEIHNDRWHCPPGVPEPTHLPTPSASEDTTSTQGSGHCEPHGDHRHCQEGSAEPTAPPATPSTAPEEGPGPACESHGDCWHCPSGAALPSGSPGGSTAPTPIVLEGSASRFALFYTSIFGFMVVSPFLV